MTLNILTFSVFQVETDGDSLATLVCCRVHDRKRKKWEGLTVRATSCSC